MLKSCNSQMIILNKIKTKKTKPTKKTNKTKFVKIRIIWNKKKIILIKRANRFRFRRQSPAAANSHPSRACFDRVLYRRI